MIALALLAGTAMWIPVGVTGSKLRVFVDRTSVRLVGRHRFARVRLGSPGVITGSVVIVYQDEDIDCRDGTWRLVGYDARDANGRVVERRGSVKRASSALPAVAGTIGGAVVATVCAF